MNRTYLSRNIQWDLLLKPGLPDRLLTGEVSGLRSTWVDDEPRLGGRVGG